MQVDFYGSRLCPRCARARKHIEELQKDFPSLDVKFIEITTSPLSSMKNGVFMIPALKSGQKKLSGILLSKEEIKEFLREAEHNSKN